MVSVTHSSLSGHCVNGEGNRLQGMQQNSMEFLHLSVDTMKIFVLQSDCFEHTDIRMASKITFGIWS